MRNITSIDDRDCAIVSVRGVEAHLADVLMSENGTPIRLNRLAMELAIKTLQETVQKMEVDPHVDVPAVYGRRTSLPWWQVLDEGSDIPSPDDASNAKILEAMIAADDKGLAIVEVNLVEAYLADVLMAEDGRPIRLNRHALEFAVQTLQKWVQEMDSDPHLDVPAVYDKKTQRPRWEGFRSSPHLP